MSRRQQTEVWDVATMLDAFIIFARGGIILFSWTAVALKGNPVDALVSNVLLEERSGKSDYTYTTGATKYTLKWSFHNELELVFVAVRVPLPDRWLGSRRMCGSFADRLDWACGCPRPATLRRTPRHLLAWASGNMPSRVSQADDSSRERRQR